MAEHLSLTESQKGAIQQVMARERHHMEPLMAQSRSIREKRLALDPQHSNKKEIKTPFPVDPRTVGFRFSGR